MKHSNTYPNLDHRKQRQIELNQLSKPFWTALVIGSISLLLFVSYLTILMDRGALLASEQTFQSIIKDRVNGLEKVALENGYWDEAVENSVYQQNESWITENFIDFMSITYQLAGVHVFDGSDNLAINIANGRYSSEDNLSHYGNTVGELLSKARASQTEDGPVPVSGFLGDGQFVYLSSAINLTTYTSTKNIPTDHVLVITQRIDREYLAAIQETYQLWDLDYVSDEIGFTSAHSTLNDLNGNLLSGFSWNPPLTGRAMLPSLAIGVLVVFIGMLYTARVYLMRAGKLIQELEQARMRAEVAKEQLDAIARQDPLTGIGNRRKFEETIAAIKQRPNSGSKHAFVSVDLDGFKQINDTYGHEAGDSVLRHFADLFRNLLSEHGTVFRLGGDEFCAILRSNERNHTIAAAERILENLADAQMIDGQKYEFGTSIGISFSDDVDLWMPEADKALYAAKRNGRGCLFTYDQITDEKLVDAA